MTLILTAANLRGIYQSSDYQLTDQRTGKPVANRAGLKQLEARFDGMTIMLAFTGVAAVGSGANAQRTIDHLTGGGAPGSRLYITHESWIFWLVLIALGSSTP
jgi:hypothetical protein